VFIWAAWEESMPTFCYIQWDFGFPELTDLDMEVTIHNDPPHFPWIYLQAYDFRMYLDRPEFGERGIYSYHGMQTNVYDPSKGGRGTGLLYSRFETLDPQDLRVAPGGWIEIPDSPKIAAEGGHFIGVRNSFRWGEGRYRLSLRQTDEDASGDWLGFFVQDLTTGNNGECGNLRFPKIGGTLPRIPGNGSTWLELYPQNEDPASFPFWHVSISNVTANSGQRRAKSALVTYDDAQIPARNSDVCWGPGNRSIEIRVGMGVKRTTPNGTLLSVV
jgi:hypothetical protein